jgi:phosphatidate cytidylyltransferase
MLKLRLVTAALLAPLVIGSVLYAQSWALALFFALILVLGAWEWAALSAWVSPRARISYAVLIALSLVLVYFYGDGLQAFSLTLACIWWVFTLFWVIRWEQGDHDIVLAPWGKLLAGVVIFIATFQAVLVLHADSRYGSIWLVFFLVLIWSADSGAYFAGRLWGKRKLAAHISPGKTWAGVYGALALSLLVAALFGIWQGLSGIWLVLWLLLCLLTVAVSILGDLVESLLKRLAKVKDSSQLLPGHGGILDRIDSILAAAPIFLVSLHVLEWRA